MKKKEDPRLIPRTLTNFNIARTRNKQKKTCKKRPEKKIALRFRAKHLAEMKKKLSRSSRSNKRAQPAPWRPKQAQRPGRFVYLARPQSGAGVCACLSRAPSA